MIETKFGPIQGTVQDGVTCYKGIPFAVPPVGELRFMPPRDPAAWQEVLDCSAFRPSAIQVAKKDEGIAFDEDCLYLNIWAPEDAVGKSLPVLVFIHGGAYTQGSPAKSLYDGTRFAKDGIIQVNISYRLNALGFLGFPEVAEKYGNVGNCGTLDQIKALQWVQDNIAAFGGDAGNVTISGESAGSFSVSNLLMSPLAKGLFQRAIMESGNLLGQPVIVPLASGDVGQALECAASFTQSLGGQTLADMQQMDAMALAEASLFSVDITNPAPYSFWPAFDGHVLPKEPYKALVAGENNGVDIMAGYNTDEGSMFVPEGITEEAYINMVANIFGEGYEEVLQRYPVDAEHTATDRARDIFLYGIRLGSEAFADEFSRQGNNVYYYNFDLEMPLLDEMGMGTAHAMELFFVFDNIPPTIQLDEAKLAFKEDLHNRWLNFIVSGNPNTGVPVGPQWPLYTPEGREILVLNADTTAGTLQNTDDTKFLFDWFWKD